MRVGTGEDPEGRVAQLLPWEPHSAPHRSPQMSATERGRGALGASDRGNRGDLAHQEHSTLSQAKASVGSHHQPGKLTLTVGARGDTKQNGRPEGGSERVARQ